MMRDKTVVMARRPSSVGGGAIVVTCAASAPGRVPWAISETSSVTRFPARSRAVSVPVPVASPRARTAVGSAELGAVRR